MGDVRDFLRQVFYAGRSVRLTTEKLRRARSMAEKMTAMLSAEPRGGQTSDKVGAGVERIQMLEDELAAVSTRWDVYYREAAQLFGRLTDERQKRVMELRYLHALPWGEVMARVFYARRHVFRLHDDAVARLTRR